MKFDDWMHALCMLLGGIGFVVMYYTIFGLVNFFA